MPRKGGAYLYKPDGNHSDIRDAFRARGFSWRDTHMIGKGFPDGVAGMYGQNLLVEIKDPSKPPSSRKLTPDEQAFHNEWQGAVVVVMTEADVESIYLQMLSHIDTGEGETVH